MILCFSVIKNQVTEKRKNKKNKILLILLLFLPKNQVLGRFNLLKPRRLLNLYHHPQHRTKGETLFDAADDIVLYVTRQIKEHLSDSTLAEQFTHFTISFLLNKLEMSIYDLQDHSGFEFEVDLFLRT